jgi:protein SSD1
MQLTFAERAARLGYNMDASSSSALMRSMQAIEDPSASHLLQILLLKATQRAKYFCAGMLDIAKYQHYSLGVPLYAHFTSPIRRYADVLVHRQLESASFTTGSPFILRVLSHQRLCIYLPSRVPKIHSGP